MKFGYARVSSETQDINTQIDILFEIGVEREDIFTDVSSGVNAERNGFDKLFCKLKKGDTLYVCKLDRIARNAYHLAKLIKHFEVEGINFKSIEEPIINTTSTNSIYLFSFFGLMRKLESDLQVERTKAGLDSAKRRGRLGGRQKGLSLEASKKARIAEEMYKNNIYSISEICEFLNIGSRRTLYAYLRSRNVEIGSYTLKKK